MTPPPSLEGDFSPSGVPRVVFGRGAVERLGEEVERLGARRALVVCSRTLARDSDAVARVKGLLGDRCVGSYAGFSTRAPIPEAVEAAKLALEREVDLLVGIGGSTIPDGARLVAVMVAQNAVSAEGLRELERSFAEQPPPDLNGVRLARQIHIPTTLSAGEFSIGKARVLDPAARRKLKTDHPALHTDVVILDPEMTRWTPDWLWHSTGIKALDHAIERLYARGNQPAVDGPVLLASELLFRYLPVSGEGRGDLDARLQCQVGAWLSMMGVRNTSFGLSHAIGHALGIRYGVPHGYTSCVTQPCVMEYNRPASVAKQARFALAVGVDTRGMSEEGAAVEGARAVARLISELGLPSRIRDLDIPQEALPELAEHVARNSYARDNAIPVTDPQQALEVLKRAW